MIDFSCLSILLFSPPSLVSEVPVAPPPRLVPLDAAGDRLPSGARTRLGTARLRHPDAIRDLAFSPDNSRLAVTSDDGSVSVWDSHTGRLVGRAEVGPGAAVGFVPGGDGVGTFTPGFGLRALEPDVGKVVRTVRSDRSVGGRGATGRQPSPVLAPGLRWMAYEEFDRNRRSKVIVVDPATDRETAALATRHHGWMTRVGFSADGTRLVIGDGESARFTLWVLDPASSAVIFENRVEGLYPEAVSLSRDGERVAALGLPHAGPVAATARVWDVASGRLLLDRPVNRNHHVSAVLAPDGKALAVLEQFTISLVDVGTGKSIRTLGTRCQNGRLVYSPDGRKLAVASNSNTLEIFDVASGRVVPDRSDRFDLDFRYDTPPGWVRFRPDGTLLAHLYDEPGVSVWNPRTGRRIESIPLPPGGRSIHAVSPDGRRLIYSSGPAATVGEFRLWDRDRKADVATSAFPGLVGPQFAFTADGRLFLHPEFVYVKPPEVWKPEVWELEPATLKRVSQWVVPGGPYCKGWGGSRVSEDGLTRFELPADARGHPRGTIRQWKVTDGTEGAVIRWAPEETLSADEDRLGEVRALGTTAVSRDGRWVAVQQFIGRRGEATSDNRDRVSGGRFVSVFDAADGRERSRFPIKADPGAEPIRCGMVAVSPDGKLVAVYDLRGACRVYETASGTERKRVSEERGTCHNVTKAEFSPDSRLLLTYSAAGGALVWDVRAGVGPDHPIPDRRE